MRIKILLTALVVIFLTACGADGSREAQPAPVLEAETLDLQPNVDVHTVASIKDRDDVLLIDVREQYEYDDGHIPNITLIPMGQVVNRLDEIPTDREVIVTCRSGNRSHQVTEFLREKGFTNVHNMEGGILAWEKAGYAVE